MQIYAMSLPKTRKILVVRGKPFVSPYANDASWHWDDPVPSATESPIARPLASVPSLVPSIYRPTCAPCLSACDYGVSSLTNLDRFTLTFTLSNSWTLQLTHTFNKTIFTFSFLNVMFHFNKTKVIFILQIYWLSNRR